ncbi:MAG: 16S rRNA processing protein RimM [Firmicutes bacterium]|nr:16S rRNA processing protein RimM [Bacillota bacterium]
MESPNDWVVIGEITRPHGLQGYVKVRMHTDFPHRFDDLTCVYVQQGNAEPKQSGFRLVAKTGGQLVCQITGISDRDSAGELRGALILLPRALAVKPEPGAYYIFDLVGLSVHSEDGALLGTLKEVIKPGANDVYIVEQAESKKQILLPAINDVILDIDLESGRMLVRLLPGLLDE